jgi:hypothetical protein
MKGPRLDTKEQTDKRLDLIRRLPLAGFADTTIFERVPNDAMLISLPDDDEAFVDRELRIGAKIAKKGQNVYFLHIRTSVLPE